jgi:hypothetical protein
MTFVENAKQASWRILPTTRVAHGIRMGVYTALTTF